jgi:membrane associated rhomboid family serine protease
MTTPSRRLQPVTASLAFAAIAASLWWWSGRQIEALMMDGRAWLGEPWRLLTSVLPHLDVIHLIFNVYWLGIFGGRVEQEFGSIKTGLMYIVLGAGSSAAQYAFHEAGVGLSGIGYGLFGFLWFMYRKHGRFSDVIGPKIIQLFVVWFFFCIATTITSIWTVGNIAHAAGALIGLNLAWITSAERPARRQLGWAVLVVAFTLLFAAASIGRPYVNISDSVGDELAYLGYRALTNNNPERAVRFLKRAVWLEPEQADWWYNLGIAYQQSEMYDEAIKAYEMAHQRAPDSEEFKKALLELREWWKYD